MNPAIGAPSLTLTAADGTVVDSTGNVLQTTTLAPVEAPVAAAAQVEKYRTLKGVRAVSPDSAILSLPFSGTYSVFNKFQFTPIFKSNVARICVDPIKGVVAGHPSTDNLYFNLFHWHPTTQVWDSEGRSPVHFELNNVWHFYCWINQNTANQWGIGFEQVVGPDSGTATGPYTVANS